MENPPDLRVLPDPVPVPQSRPASAAREQIALCVIVHNEPKRLDRCLTAFGPAVSEIVVVHATGSTPRSEEVRAIARKHRAVYDFFTNPPEAADWPHVSDFGAARQLSFDLASREWALWVDADDVPGEGFAEALHELLDKHGNEFDAFCLNHVVAGRGIAHNMRERLVRRSAGRWENRIHENFVITSDKKRIARCDAPVVVHLPDNEAKQGSGRNLRILESIPPEEVTAEVLYHIHGELMGAGRKQEALEKAKEALRHPDCRSVERYELCLNIAELARPTIIETDKPEYAAMMTALHQAYRTQPNRREALALLGAMHLDLGDFVAAEAYLRAMMALPVPASIPWTHRQALYGWAGETLWTQLLRMVGRGEQADAIERARIKAHAGTPTISICHPTRGRPEIASFVRKQWLDAAANAERIEHIFGMEADSPDLALLGRFRHALAPAGLLGRKSGNCVLANNAAVRAASGDIIICIGDDMGRPPLHWDEMISAELRGYLDKPAMLTLRDQHRKDDLIVTPCVTRPTLAALGYDGGIYCEEYASMFADTELTVRADANGWLVKSQVVIPHDHPAHDKSIAIHETTARNNSAENYINGLETFKRRNPEYCERRPDVIAEMDRIVRENT